MQIGTSRPERRQQRAWTHFGRVAKISFDAKANEAYVADGYGNKRVAVIDMTTRQDQALLGRLRQQAERLEPRPLQSRRAARRSSSATRCTAPSRPNDGLVYVCDRPNDRIQVFRKDGTFVKEARIAPQTLGDGSVWDIAFSRDPAQKYLFLADGKNEKVYVMDRQSLEILTNFGDGGRQPGQFFARAQHRDRLEGQHLHDRDLRGQAPAEVRLPRRAEAAAQSGRAVAAPLSDR